MATTTGTLVLFDSFIGLKGDGSIDLNGDTFIVGLSTSAYVPNKDTQSVLADITNEVAGNGYARQTLANVTWSEPLAGTWMFNADDAVYSAVGGSIVARYFWIFDDTVLNDPLVCYGLLDNTPADVTTTDGNTLTIQVNASGLFRESAP